MTRIKLTAAAAGVLAAAVVLVAVFPPHLFSPVSDHPPARPPAVVERELSCGPKCLYVAAGRLGVPLDWAAVAAHFRDGTTGGTSIRDLAAAAERFGMTTDTGSADWDAVRRHPGIAILFVRGDHFITVDPREKPPVGVAPDAVRAYDPDRVANWLTRSEAEAMWEGEALRLSPPADAPSPGPRLAISSCYEDAGLVRDQLRAEYRLPVRNRGGTPLALSILGSSCNCTSTRLTSEVVPPGGEVILEAAVKLDQKQGRYAEMVVIGTNDPDAPRVTFILTGGVYRTNVLSSQKLHVGGLTPGTTTRHHVAVHDPGDRRLRASEVSAAIRLAKPVSGAVSQPTCAVSNIVPGVATEVRERLNMAKEDALLEFEVVVPSDCPPGSFEYLCLVRTNLPEATEIELVLQGSILPDLVAEPPALIVNIPAGVPATTATLVVRSKSKTPVSNLAVHSQLPCNLTTTAERYEADRATLTFAIATPRCDDATVEGVLRCTSPDGRTIQIPVMLIRSSTKQ